MYKMWNYCKQRKEFTKTNKFIYDSPPLSQTSRAREKQKRQRKPGNTEKEEIRRGVYNVRKNKETETHATHNSRDERQNQDLGYQ